MLQKKIVLLAQQAGEEIMKFHQDKNLRIENKEDNSPVTAADLNAHKIIFAGLKSLSNDVIISEESDLDKNLNLVNRRFWLVDPLDGTRDFIAGLNTFCVSIALIDCTQPILGVLYAPVSKEIFYAAQGEGCFFNNKKVYNSSERTDLFALASGANYTSERMESFLKVSNIHKLSRFGSALKFGHLARGDADIYPRFGETSEWDTAAGQIICSEAGCEVFDIRTLSLLKYAKANFRNSGFIAVRKDLLPQFQKMMSEMRLSPS